MINDVMLVSLTVGIPVFIIFILMIILDKAMR